MPLDIARESRDYVDRYRADGYAIVRGLFDAATMAQVQEEARRIYAEGLKHRATYRDRNLLFEILPEAHGGRRYVLQAHWFAWISPFFERFRRDPRWHDLLSPLLGRDIKQVAQQLHWKPPGADLTGYRFHQDIKFRENPAAFRAIVEANITTGLAIDRATPENGCLRVVPGSHAKGYLGLSDDGPLMKGTTQEGELSRAGLDPSSIVDVVLEPGDVVLWGLLTVHGSAPNRSDRDRAFGISSYVRAADSPERGEWAFRDGVSTPLGPEPEICKYEKLREKPGPFYVEDDWYAR